jgi:acylphosphatase
MAAARIRAALLLAGIFASGSAFIAADADSAKRRAIIATVTGEKIQKVGFRAMIQKEAIMYDLAGSARNNPDGSVSVILQGDGDRIDQVLAVIRAGSKKSSQDNAIRQAPVEWNPDLNAFTVFDWTSQSRVITTKYNLIFPLRPPDDQISGPQTKAVWNKIAENTLKGDDLTKFLKHLDDDD